jgi:multidrug resistance efflux pump
MDASRLEAEKRAAVAEERQARLEAELEAREQSFRAAAAEAEEQWQRRLDLVQRSVSSDKKGDGQQPKEQHNREDVAGAYWLFPYSCSLLTQHSQQMLPWIGVSAGQSPSASVDDRLAFSVPERDEEH